MIARSKLLSPARGRGYRVIGRCLRAGHRRAIREILAQWSRAAHASAQLRAAVELACDCTGMRLSGVAIETLKAVMTAHPGDPWAFGLMKDNIPFMLNATAEAGDNSLLDLPRLIEDLAALPGSPATTFRFVDNQEPRTRRPMALFLITTASLPVSHRIGVVGALSSAQFMRVHHKIPHACRLPLPSRRQYRMTGNVT